MMVYVDCFVILLLVLASMAVASGEAKWYHWLSFWMLLIAAILNVITSC